MIRIVTLIMMLFASSVAYSQPATWDTTSPGGPRAKFDTDEMNKQIQLYNDRERFRKAGGSGPHRSKKSWPESEFAKESFESKPKPRVTRQAPERKVAPARRRNVEREVVREEVQPRRRRSERKIIERVEREEVEPAPKPRRRIFPYTNTSKPKPEPEPVEQVQEPVVAPAPVEVQEPSEVKCTGIRCFRDKVFDRARRLFKRE